jgi:beta-glucosidase/6-phospho-beta-glucosidase/beta-galactosidase
MTRTFPPGFLWGVTTGAHRTEGYLEGLLS